MVEQFCDSTARLLSSMNCDDHNELTSGIGKINPRKSKFIRVSHKSPCKALLLLLLLLQYAVFVIGVFHFILNSALHYRFDFNILVTLQMPCAYNVFVFSLTDAYVCHVCTGNTHTHICIYGEGERDSVAFALNKGCPNEFIGRISVSVNELPMKHINTHG